MAAGSRAGLSLLTKHVERLREADPEIGDFHEAFEEYCAQKYSLGSSGITQRVGGSRDLGIDFFSANNHQYHVGQCKILERDWLNAHPDKVKNFNQQVVGDPRSALSYLLGDASIKPNDQVRHLFSLIAEDRKYDDFHLTFFLIVCGKLSERASVAFRQLESEYTNEKVSLVLRDVDDLSREFLIGSEDKAGDIKLTLRIAKGGQALREKDYCYFLANAADLFKGFQEYGWRLFDLNIRYEVQNSPINANIVDSLRRQKSRRNFHHYNNGIIIIAKRYKIRKKGGSAIAVDVTGAQIVNGLQTVKSIYNGVADKDVQLEEINKDCVVQVKVIQSSDAQFLSEIVQSTNNQNPMADRNLKANSREQKQLKTSFAELSQRWFCETKQGEWDSLTSESSHFFKQVIGYSVSDFRPTPGRKPGRIIRNTDAAKAWLCFLGFADLAGDRVTHFFSKPEVYKLAFMMRPGRSHWESFARSTDFDSGRHETLQEGQASASQYLFAYLLLSFAKGFVPAPSQYREYGLEEGVRAGKIEKRSGSFTSSPSDQETYLAENQTYQTWRLMANMKELLVETAAHLLARKYEDLSARCCEKLLRLPEGKGFATSGQIRDIAATARMDTDLNAEQILARTFSCLRFAAAQYWEEKQKSLQARSRIRTVLLSRNIAAEFKAKVWELQERRGLDKSWKPEGKTFLESLPQL